MHHTHVKMLIALLPICEASAYNALGRIGSQSGDQEFFFPVCDIPHRQNAMASWADNGSVELHHFYPARLKVINPKN